MMTTQERLIDIARRRERLSLRAQAERLEIAGRIGALREPIGLVDRALGIARFLRAHPVLVSVAVAALVAFRGRGLAGLAGRALSAWRLWRAISAWSGARPL